MDRRLYGDAMLAGGNLVKLLKANMRGGDAVKGGCEKEGPPRRLGRFEADRNHARGSTLRSACADALLLYTATRQAYEKKEERLKQTVQDSDKLMHHRVQVSPVKKYQSGPERAALFA